MTSKTFPLDKLSYPFFSVEVVLGGGIVEQLRAMSLELKETNTWVLDAV